VNKIIGIKAISFDADGTLWDFEKVMRHSLFHVLVELKKLDPEAVDMLNVDKMVEIRNRVANEFKDRVSNLKKVRLEPFDKPSETSVDPMTLWHCALIRYT
jgi:phosphoglycolate phosphatase-like HAD superfamily hydrolase